ncbi:hypothetical protein D8Y20_01405 [Mariprofundus sp. EBB-1]|nr:hypothetical protein D8Y20_01405 [Mariprofundus sp. EBB-1]
MQHGCQCDPIIPVLFHSIEKQLLVSRRQAFGNPAIAMIEGIDNIPLSGLTVQGLPKYAGIPLHHDCQGQPVTVTGDTTTLAHHLLMEAHHQQLVTGMKGCQSGHGWLGNQLTQPRQRKQPHQEGFAQMEVLQATLILNGGKRKTLHGNLSKQANTFFGSSTLSR